MKIIYLKWIFLIFNKDQILLAIKRGESKNMRTSKEKNLGVKTLLFHLNLYRKPKKLRKRDITQIMSYDYFRKN